MEQSDIILDVDLVHSVAVLTRSRNNVDFNTVFLSNLFLRTNYIHLAYHTYGVSLTDLFYKYQNINFEIVSFCKCL